MRTLLKRVVALLSQAIQVFNTSRSPTHAAAIAYFTIFSLAPLVVMAVAIAGLFVGRAAAAGEITGLLAMALGTEVASYVNALAMTVAEQSSSATFTLISIGVLIVGASAVFSQLKRSLDDIWGQQVDDMSLTSGVIYTVRRRALAFLMILVAGAALLLSVILDLFLIQLGQVVEFWWPGINAVQPYLSWLITPIIGFLAFTTVFKLLPETRPSWRAVFVGAALTTVLFTIGTALIGFFLTTSGTTSIYGAAGSLIVTLLWVYYSSWIILFGASFTRVYGDHLSGLATSNGFPSLKTE